MNELCRLIWCGLIGLFRSRTSLEAEMSLPKTIFERIDGVGRLESDRRQCPRTARSDVYRACPSQAKRGFAPHYNNSRISQGFAEGGQHLTLGNGPCTRAGS